MISGVAGFFSRPDSCLPNGPEVISEIKSGGMAAVRFAD